MPGMGRRTQGYSAHARPWQGRIRPLEGLVIWQAQQRYIAQDGRNTGAGGKSPAYRKRILKPLFLDKHMRQAESTCRSQQGKRVKTLVS